MGQTYCVFTLTRENALSFSHQLHNVVSGKYPLIRKTYLIRYALFSQ